MRLVEEAAKLALVQLRCTKSAAATCGSRHTKVGGCKSWCEAPGFGPIGSRAAASDLRPPCAAWSYAVLARCGPRFAVEKKTTLYTEGERARNPSCMSNLCKLLPNISSTLRPVCNTKLCPYISARTVGPPQRTKSR